MAETTQRNKAIKYIELSLGGGMVDVELDREHYDMAIDKALSKYRQRSSRAVEESFIVFAFSPVEPSFALTIVTVSDKPSISAVIETSVRFCVLKSAIAIFFLFGSPVISDR